jgi:simple sugar transport system ATP-binding protein
MSTVIEMKDITMSFGANEVLKGIDLALEAGKVTALLGANGAGKSTLIKVLSGVYNGYGGAVIIDGATVDIDHPTTARKYGIEAVHQKIADGVVPGLSVAENFLFEGIVNNTVSRAASHRSLMPKAREVASVLDLNWSDDVLRSDVYQLPIAEQQMLLLTRALVHEPRLLILDEPTSALSTTEAERLFDVIRRLRDDGVAILYVSHRLGEIDSISDRLLVLRDGLIVSDQEAPIDWPSALHEMLGSKETGRDPESSKIAELHSDRGILELQGIQLLPRSAPFDLTIRSGEVTGVFGLLGSGGNELAHGMFGSTPLEAGTMILDGETFAPKAPADAIAKDVYMVPEDRTAGTIIKEFSLSAIATFPFLADIAPRAVLDKRRQAAVGRSVIEDFGVVAQGPDDPIVSLSGGNQQKVVVGRWLRKQPKVMILNEPFQGVDVGARHDLAERAREVAAAGSAVVVMSTDLGEIWEVSDRVIVLADGNLRHDAYLSDTSRDEILERLSEVE